MPSAECPGLDAIADYVLGKLSEVELEWVAEHLEVCRDCQATLEHLDSGKDTLVVPLAELTPVESLRGDPAFHQAVQRLVATLGGPAVKESSTASRTPSGDTLGAGKPPLSVRQFARRVAESGLLSNDEVRAFIAGLPPQRRPADGQRLAQELMRAGKLTRFQASSIYQGRVKGFLLGAYTVVDRLGAGGMGHVFKAEHRQMGRTVALKVLPVSARRLPEAVQRFEREVQAAARLQHPNIVEAHDAGEHNGAPFLVMEYVAGRDLHDLVQHHGPLPLKLALDYVIQAARGLDYAHSQGVVHRDIKPANLLVDGYGTVKILDMGLARLSSADSRQHELTGTHQIMGTVDFMAPEQALNTRYADHRADIYSLGITLWYLLTGRRPFETQTVWETLLAHREREIPSLRESRPDVSPQLEAVFRRMVARDAADRYQAMSEVLAALEGISPDGIAPPSPPAACPADDIASEEVVAAVAVASPGGNPFAAGPPMTRTIAPPLRHGAAASSFAGAPSAPRRSAPGRSLRAAAVVAAGLAGALAMWGVIVVVRGDRGQQVARMTVPEIGRAEVHQVPTPPDQPTRDATRQPPPATPSPAPTTSTAAQRVPDGSPAALTRSTSALRPGWTLGPAVDLLALVDPARDAVQGRWQRDAEGLISPAARYGRLQVPYRPPSDYLLELELESVGDGATGLQLGIPVAGRQVLAVFDSPSSGNWTGLELDGWASNARQYQGQLFAPGKSSTVSITVRGTSITLAAEGRQLVEYSGDPERLVVGMPWQVPDKAAVFLGSWEKPYRLRRLALRALLSPSSDTATTAAPAALPAAFDDRAAAEWVLSQGGSVELLAGGAVQKASTAGVLPAERFELQSICFSGFKDQTVTVEDLARLPGLRFTRLDLARSSISDAALLIVGKFTQLQSLSLFQNYDVTDAGLKHLAGLSALETLSLQRTRTTDAGLPHVAAIKSLKTLYLGDLPLTDAGLEVIATLPNLESLSLNGCGRLSGQFAAHFRDHPKLRHLAFNTPYIKPTRQGLEAIAAISRLETLNLGDRATYQDEWLSLLAGHPNLHTLVLTGCPIGDAAVPHLNGITKLAELHIGGTKLTAAGVAELKKAKPALKVFGAPLPSPPSTAPAAP